jgi:hypothetical protein
VSAGSLRHPDPETARSGGNPRSDQLPVAISPSQLRVSDCGFRSADFRRIRPESKIVLAVKSPTRRPRDCGLRIPTPPGQASDWGFQTRRGTKSAIGNCSTLPAAGGGCRGDPHRGLQLETEHGFRGDAHLLALGGRLYAGASAGAGNSAHGGASAAASNPANGRAEGGTPAGSLAYRDWLLLDRFLLEIKRV